MRYLFAILFLASVILRAEPNWRLDYEKAKADAQKSGKPMLVLLVSHTCRWCLRLENRTLQNPRVCDYVNRRFIPVLLYREEGDFPDFIHSAMVPATFFLTPDEKMITKPVVGYWPPKEYMSDLKEAIKRFESRSKR